MKNTNLIPTSFCCGGIPVEVRHAEKLDNSDAGHAHWCGGYIEIAQKMDYNIPQSDGSKINTFFHELIHTILKNMGEFELNNNEKFVCAFAGFLTEAMTTAEYPTPKAEKTAPVKTTPKKKTTRR